MAGYRLPSKYSTLFSALGLTSGLRLVLDAGDSASYSSGQSWLDRSGNGYDFFLGTTSASQGADPVFTGTPGNLSANEYWAHDTDALFTYDSANETWMNNLHKDGAQYTILAWVYLTSYGAGSSQCVMGTLGNAGSPAVGMQFQVNTTTGVLRIQVSNAGATPDSFVSSGAAIGLNGWHLVGITVSENGGASAGQFYLDGATNGAAFNPAYSAPQAGAATSVMQVAADGASLRPLGLNGAARMGMIAIWEGTTLNATQIAAIYNAGVVVTGVTGTGTAGTIGVAEDKGVTGVTGTGAAGTITANPAGVLLQAAGTGTAGSLSALEEKGVNGVAGTGVAGDIILRYVNFSGVAGIGTAGSLSAQVDKPITGVAGVGVAGTISDEVAPTITSAVGGGVAGEIGAGPGSQVPGCAGEGVAGQIGVVISGGGGSTAGSGPGSDDRRKRDPRLKTGLEPVKKRKRPDEKPEAPKVWTPPIPDRELETVLHRPAPELVDRRELPADLLAIQEQMFSAEDISDVERFLNDYDLDQQDADDIADILALLD